ncbi:MAG: hypothetical protein ACRED8_11400 [Caulobacteraceae bacterium]
MRHAFIEVLIGLQVFVVAFLGLHDYVPLPPLNDVAAVQAADSRSRLAAVTLLSALPFALGLLATIDYAGRGLPGWLMWWLWVSFGAVFLGGIRAWWVPYFLTEEPVRVARYRAMFGATHAFLPERNGIRPNTLHIVLHLSLVAVLVVLGMLTF